ncbi:MAG: hypothetical protein ACYS8Z_22485 [Planctomycetota bacterium]
MEDFAVPGEDAGFLLVVIRLRGVGAVVLGLVEPPVVRFEAPCEDAGFLLVVIRLRGVGAVVLGLVEPPVARF